MLRDIVHMVRHTGKWWLAPILLAIAIFGLLMFLGSTGVAPFIYTLF